MIEQPPTTWKELQVRVATILLECGMRAEVEHQIQTAREKVNIDVYAEDPLQRPAAKYVCECKNWKTAVPKSVVHSLRTVVTDFGANWGFIISAAGFQSGAYDAASNSNIHLVDWYGFQALFVDRWWQQFAVPRFQVEADPLVEYTEPINTRVFRRADTLTEAGQAQFVALRDEYQDLAFFALPYYLEKGKARGARPQLPISSLLKSMPPNIAPNLPPDLLDQTLLRGFVHTLCHHLRTGIAKFDELFGGRA